MTNTIMVQGTSSDAGKSLLVAGLCRVLARLGKKVAPFKPQNMALNSAVTPCGGEIGRAQAVQAMAAGVALQVHFNPILLKPSSDTGAQVIVQGKALTDMEAKGYHDYKKVAMTAVLDSHQRLEQQFDYIVVEGAGSPAEINLREGDIANMGFAEAVDCPVILVADIDRGGVFAQIVGTLDLLSDTERERVVGFVINKFRGDVSLLQPGLDWLEARTNKPVLGVLPFLQGVDIAAEDAINVEQRLNDTKLTVVVPVVSRISNHTDFDPLRLHPQINLVFAGPGKPLPAADLIILPGSKNVRRDLQFLREQGWEADINKHLRYGGKLLGICGGYQMLGEVIDDPKGVEEAPGSIQGLGFLPLRTQLQEDKTLCQTRGVLTLGGESCEVAGYEIHMGATCSDAQLTPLIAIEKGQIDGVVSDGVVSDDNQIAGTYLHGLFEHDKVIEIIARWAGSEVNQQVGFEEQQQQALDVLADAVEQYVDLAVLR